MKIRNTVLSLLFFAGVSPITTVFGQVKTIKPILHGLVIYDVTKPESWGRNPSVKAIIIAKNWIDYEKVESPYKYKDFTAFNINPKSNWKYALCLDSTRIADDINIKFRDIKRNPWDLENAPVELRIPAKEICGWETIKTNSLVYQKHGNNQTVVIHDNFELTPGIPERTFIRKHLLPTIDTVTFVPLGCTRIRLTVLPLVSNKN